MSKEKILEALRGMEFFRGIGDEHLQHLAGISRLIEFPAHSTIFRENELGSDVYVVINGRVSLVICAPKVGCRTLMEVGDGELIGWSPLVGRPRLSDTAHTVTATSAIAIKGEQLLTLCGEHPQFGFEFMHRAAQVLAQRLAATRIQMVKMTGRQLPEVVLESD